MVESGNKKRINFPKPELKKEDNQKLLLKVESFYGKNSEVAKTAQLMVDEQFRMKMNRDEYIYSQKQILNTIPEQHSFLHAMHRSNIETLSCQNIDNTSEPGSNSNTAVYVYNDSFNSNDLQVTAQDLFKCAQDLKNQADQCHAISDSKGETNFLMRAETTLVPLLIRKDPKADVCKLYNEVRKALSEVSEKEMENEWLLNRERFKNLVKNSSFLKDKTHAPETKTSDQCFFVDKSQKIPLSRPGSQKVIYQETYKDSILLQKAKSNFIPVPPEKKISDKCSVVDNKSQEIRLSDSRPRSLNQSH